MDHRIIDVDEQTVLLDRIAGNEYKWQVYISCWLGLDDRYDEWVDFRGPMAARQYIADFSQATAWQFVERAKAWQLQQTRADRQTIHLRPSWDTAETNRTLPYPA